VRRRDEALHQAGRHPGGTSPPTETSNYFTPTFSNRPSYTYTPGYYSYYYTPAYYMPTTSPTTCYYRN
jgi:hypothetical protein